MPIAKDELATRRKALLATPSGFGSDAVKDIAGALNALLADTFALYLKTKNFHWHVSGPHFRDYHLLLDEHAAQIFAMTDPIAERVRKIGGTTIRSIGQVGRLQRLKDNDADYVDPGDMIAELREDNRALAASMREAHDLCSDDNDVATTSLLESWIDETERRVWFLFETGRAARPAPRCRGRKRAGSQVSRAGTIRGRGVGSIFPLSRANGSWTESCYADLTRSMKRSLPWLGFTAVFSAAVFGQSAGPGPKFEIADVHVSHSLRAMRGGFYAGGRYELRNATMVELIGVAWSIDADKVAGGPGWLTTDRFDVIAAAPSDSTPAMLKTMLQGLLKERFKLAVHTGAREFPAYAIAVGNKPLLKPAEGTQESGCKVQERDPKPGEPLPFRCRNITMAAFADAIPRLFGAFQYLLGNPVVDQTGLKGAWNFDFKFSYRMSAAMLSRLGFQAADTITLFDAFEKQLGLRLDPVKVPMPVIAVDSVNESPTENLPGVTEKLPAARTEFEVAVIKRADPKTAGGGGGFYGSRGRVDVRNETLQDMIMGAWDLSDPDMLAGGPPFLRTDHWDVVARAPAGPELAPGFTPIGTTVDADSATLMWQALLKDRFKLRAHYEERLVPGYALVADHPKLRKADPANRPQCIDGPGPDGKDPRLANPDASILFTCLNTTVEQFAAQLRGRDGGYLYSSPPVLDATGIQGNYDIAINFSRPEMANSGAPAAARPGGDLSAPEPNGAITLFEALEKQLGLRLEARKIAAQTLVIDHLERTPTDN